MRKKWKWFWGIVVVLSVIGFFNKHQDKNSAQSGAAASNSSDTSKGGPAASSSSSDNSQPAQVVPKDEAGVIKAVEVARGVYDTGDNDMAKGASRPQRASQICAALPQKTVSDWVGTVYDLSSNNEGKGVLSIAIDNKIYVTTWNNSLSDIADHTLIDPSSEVFRDASKLHKGQVVRFSGSFIEDATDCVKESSMSLSGSISEPEFVFQFASVRAAE